ncbi:MAG TPA: GntR family transcriptional regulator [Deltaproteobacteria bacterium]|nr:GntR family transcriptional regulator [Deltaproteobacteria bacterium]
MAELDEIINEITYHKPKTVVETVTDFLRKSIIAGNLKPGKKINSKEIIDQLGISVIPFREAVRTLENEGLIFSRPGRGSWVADISRKDLEATFEMREMMEIFAVNLIQKHVKTGLNIREELNSMALDENTEKTGSEFCANFHKNLIRLANNEKLLYLYNTLSNNIRRYQSLSSAIRDELSVNGELHLPILKPLISGDYKKAKREIKAHLEGLKKEIAERIDFSR